MVPTFTQSKNQSTQSKSTYIRCLQPLQPLIGLKMFRKLRVLFILTAALLVGRSRNRFSVVPLEILSVVPPTEPCALRSTQPLKVSTRDFSWGKGGRCFWLTNYHPCSAETSRKSEALIYPEPPGPPRPVEGHLYFTLFTLTNECESFPCSWKNCLVRIYGKFSKPNMPCRIEVYGRMRLVLLGKNRKIQQNLCSRNLIHKLCHIFVKTTLGKSC